MTVQELWDRTWGTISTLSKANIDFITAVNEATEHIFAYLQKHKAEPATALLSLTFESPASTVQSLPPGARGLAERPYIDGEDDPLEPLTEDIRIELNNSTSEDPTHYELRDNKLYLFPVPGATDSNNVLGVYFKYPGDVSDYSDSIPFDGQFDMAYRSIVIALVELGVTADMTALLEKYVGEILCVLDYHRPPRTVIKDY